MSVKIDISLDEQSMIDFMMYQIYTKGAGIISLVLGVLNALFVIVFAYRKELAQALLFMIFTFVLLIGFPYLIKRSMRKNIGDNKRIMTPVTYEFSKEGIRTTTGGKSGQASWKAFTRALSRKRLIILFDSKKQSIILPVDQLGDSYADVVNLIVENMPAPAVRINRLDKKK